MNKIPMSPQTLAENPQLGILAILRDVLVTARLALLEAHMAIWDDLSEASYHGAGAECSVALVHQLDALERTLDAYFETLERERIANWRNRGSGKANEAI
jgi:hypothetical protein